MTDFEGYAAPRAELADPEADMVLSGGWQFGVPKIQRALYVIAALHLFSAVMAFVVAPSFEERLGGAIILGFVAVAHVAAASWASRRPLGATYVAVGFFVVFQVLPALLVPASLFSGLFMKLLSLALIFFAWQTARELVGTPRLVPAD